MATTKATVPQYIPQEEDPNSPFEGLFHLLRRCIHGHDTDIDSVCHYQDVFGHSCEEDHEKAAEGEYREVFYRLYEEAYGVVATINFDRKHSIYYRNLRDEIDSLECDIEDTRAEEKRLRETVKTRDKDIQDAARTIACLRQELQQAKDETKKALESYFDQQNEIVRLKARMFDLMEKLGGTE